MEQIFALCEGVNQASRQSVLLPKPDSNGSPNTAGTTSAIPVMAFIDFRKAFDTVSHTSIAAALARIRVPSSAAALIMDHVRHSSVRVLTAHGLTEAITATQGVPQGGVLSPLLFNLCLDSVLTRVPRELGADLFRGRARLSALAYADDLVLVGKDIKSLRTMISKLPLAATEVGLRVNANKSAVMIRSAPDPLRMPSALQPLINPTITVPLDKLSRSRYI